MRELLVHPVTALTVYPTLAAYVVAKCVAGQHAAVHEFEVRLSPALATCLRCDGLRI